MGKREEGGGERARGGNRKGGKGEKGGEEISKVKSGRDVGGVWGSEGCGKERVEKTGG